MATVEFDTFWPETLFQKNRPVFSLEKRGL